MSRRLIIAGLALAVAAIIVVAALVALIVVLVILPRETWNDASSDAVQSGNISVEVLGANLERVVVLTDGDESTTPNPMLAVRIRITNVSDTQVVSYSTWTTAATEDSFRNRLRQEWFEYVDGGTRWPKDTIGSKQLSPGEACDDVLVFARPVDGFQFVRMVLPAQNTAEAIRFRIPREMVK